MVVCGSLVMDLVSRVPRHPRPGETVLGTSFGVFLGGKGFNQALAAARLGATVEMVGCVGDDEFGDRFLAALDEEGIAGTHVHHDSEGTGVAVPVVDAAGQNTIVMVPRANMRLSAEQVAAASSVLAGAAVLMLQLEVPVEASLEAATIVRRGSGIVVWNLAPYAALPDGALGVADVVVVNEAEAGGLLGTAPHDQVSALRSAHVIRTLGAGSAVVTLGAGGVAFEGPHESGALPAHSVHAVDTVGAGDAFCGALGWALASGFTLGVAVRYGNAAGALATLTHGAGPSMPRLERVLAMMEE